MGWWVAIVLLGCQGESGTDPAVRFSLDNEALRDEIRQINLAGYRNQGVTCADHALSGTPAGEPEVVLPIAVTSFGATFPAAAGDWVFHVVAGNDLFPVASPKPLAEGCTAANVAAGSTPEIEIRLHDLRPDYCQDGTLDPGEQCDRGPDVAGDDCASDCTFEVGVCGNGTVDSTETCDDGGTVAGDGCDDHCQTEAFVVNRRFIEDEQTAPRVAAGVDASGQNGFVVAWTDNSGRAGSDSRPPGVVFGFYNERGDSTANPVGGFTEYLVNQHLLMGSQSQPSVGWSSEGTLVTFLDSKAGDFDVYMMGYGPTRALLWTDERHVPSAWSGVNEQYGTVGSHPEHDGYVVAWVAGSSPARRGMLRLLDGQGEALTGDVPFEDPSLGDDFLPAVAVRGDGSSAVAWAQGTTADANIRLARFTAAGAPSGAGETVTSAAGLQTEPSLAFDAAGRLLVVWVDVPTASIRGRLYPPAGAAEAEFAISTGGFTTGAAEAGRVTTSVAAGEGVFFVVWAAQNDSVVRGRLVTGTDAFARNRVTADEGEFQLAGPPRLPSRARVAITRGGVALVVWQDRDDFGGLDAAGGIRGRLLPVP